MATPLREPSRVAVWPLWQRAMHWSLALSVLAALLTHEGGWVHEVVGWAALGLALLRVFLGLFGPEPARFRAFVRKPRETLAYARLLRQGRAPRLLNHNPLGAWMVLVLLALSAAAAASGWLYITDRFWGEAWVIRLHAVLAWPLLGLVALHVAGVLHAGWLHRENLVAAMWHGRKRLPDSRPLD
jgi:cytochrome b